MQKTDTRLSQFIAAIASLGGGLIHLAVTPGHWQEWVLSGLFFLGIAVFQILWAGLILRVPDRRIIGLGAVANVTSIALWGQSVVWGLPVGPNAGVPEAVGLAGVMAVLLESVVVVGALWCLLPRERSAVFSSAGYRYGLGGAALIVVALTAPGMAAGLDHGHSDHRHEDSGSHSPSEGGPQEESSRGTPTPGKPSARTASPEPTGGSSSPQRGSTDGDAGEEHDDHSH